MITKNIRALTVTMLLKMINVMMEMVIIAMAITKT